jgi:hypothetical protein
MTYRDQQRLADIQAAIDEDLPELERAAQAMLAALPEDPAQE